MLVIIVHSFFLAFANTGQSNLAKGYITRMHKKPHYREKASRKYPRAMAVFYKFFTMSVWLLYPLAAEPIGQGGQLPVHFLPLMGKPCSLPYHFLAPRSDNFSWQSSRKWALSCIISLKDRSSRQTRSKRNLPVVLLTSVYYLHPLGGYSPLTFEDTPYYKLLAPPLAGPFWGSLQRSPRPPSWWGGGLAAPPKNPAPCPRPQSFAPPCDSHPLVLIPG